jgi:hypothetical protein
MGVKLVARLCEKDPCRQCDFPGNCARILPSDLLRDWRILSIVALLP